MMSLELHKRVLLIYKLNLGEEKEGWKSGVGKCARTVVNVLGIG